MTTNVTCSRCQTVYPHDIDVTDPEWGAALPETGWLHLTDETLCDVCADADPDWGSCTIHGHSWRLDGDRLACGWCGGAAHHRPL
ncbi:hypothetical protein [Stackebrandtia soli]|uniref:hypothetical protein n=1 Tax=Stackebrandtia soli TaxID=1892856 RepID=UPI0039E9D8CA